MNVVSDSLKSGSALADDYINHYSRVQDLYGADFREEAAWSSRVQWLDESEGTRMNRKALVTCLRQYNKRHNDHQEVHNSLDLLEQTGTLAIVGGQQSGLFTGSLLVVYKALTIVLAAKEAQEKLQRPVVPVFWIAGEDHDWDEVNHTYVMTPELQVAKIKMDAAPGPKGPVSHTRVTAQQWKKSLDHLAGLLPDSVNKPEILELLHQSIEESGNLSDAFAKLLGRLFGSMGLILLDSADPSLRKLEIPVFERMIDHNDKLGQTYQAAAGRITGKGYSLQADVTEDGANLFYIYGGNRLLLQKQNGNFTDRKGIVNFSKEQLRHELESHPERFSNNVLTRPLMQESLLPVLCTVLGQGEISYWAITKNAFPVLGLKMPILLPRMSFTLTNGTVRKYMTHFGLSFQDVQHRYEEARQNWLNAQVNLHIEPRFEETRRAFKSLYEPLIQELGTVQSGLTYLGEKNKVKILEQITYLERKTKQALEKQHEAALRQWEQIYVSLFPMGKPQERVYNIFYYINRYGFGWIDDILGSCTRYTAEHQIIEMQ
ncbi:bacillithiol biosynthesis cysteine-adding enzyme BshC [Paenibacillus sp.]|jgi:bacillithiol biosynthesis cysteine-adding enzyme BshC|uniref:bacillithiol biosynthesis cysteine-adding enzyme BshC n=1 Tax=Paenibacillus sp. TaxID=58172 RepID=UPI00283810C6|nr:bacillithiol biosynthesis cysteine-adding enzyme BshC [Paenibacillus sp.]MDR0268940.1 bacillithiol biosynthesis cysteine-adding enzyme BshC [Paenibacillus sp.]